MLKEESSIRLIVVDVDGTLIGSDLEIASVDVDALNRAGDAGVVLAVATGRPLASALLLAEAVPGLRYVLPSNGGAVVSVGDRKVLDEARGFAPETLAWLTELGAEHDVAVNLYTATEWHANRWDDRVALEARRCGVEPRIGRSWTGIAEPIVKLMYIGPPEAVARLRARLEPRADLTPCSTYYGEYLDVGPAGVSKGTACDALTRRLGLRAGQVLAVGDGENDIPLLSGAGTAVAVRDAHPGLVDVASHLTVRCSEGAVAAAVDGLVFHDPDARARLWQRATS
ncbi:HAD-IIB family hydrolase [Amycolatopsis anabasis]|uniref:HAD-IIB family hydrolase n=1 Tax=Amycolatopsis anabasis TaxID=1840409 RepID=UPI00131B886C|nr:HAD-IIB family hydrolase [Amycolatopsis anabasis]